ncbi:hypothetical protein ANABIO32_34180 [Rossellomorea marisflavi]|nr:hypothetical protein ANABIO32_34180 [Rossellomorea marisflavi]
MSQTGVTIFSRPLNLPLKWKYGRRLKAPLPMDKRTNGQEPLLRSGREMAAKSKGNTPKKEKMVTTRGSTLAKSPRISA